MKLMTLETYLDSCDKTKLSNKILFTYKYFGYEFEEVFAIDLNLMLTQIYPHIKLIQDQNVRLEQKEFRAELLKLYGKCVVTGNDCEEEITACHIIPFAEDGDSGVDNGLVLENNIHGTFDKYYWSINPDKLEIEINPNKKTRTIQKYSGKKANIKLNPFLYKNLKSHYDRFKENMEINT